MSGIYTLKSMQMLLCYQFCDDESLFWIFFWNGGRCEMSVISHRPPYNKNIVSKFVSRLFMKLLTVFHISKIVLLETTQECIPGWPPGMRSWKTSRNTLLERFWEPTLVLSLNVRYLYIEINANVTLLSILWWWITFSNFFGMGGGVKCLLFHTAPPTTKT